MRQGTPHDHEDRRIIPPKPDVEVDEELAFHLEQRVADYIARGMDPAAARGAALERLDHSGRRHYRQAEVVVGIDAGSREPVAELVVVGRERVDDAESEHRCSAPAILLDHLP